MKKNVCVKFSRQEKNLFCLGLSALICVFLIEIFCSAGVSSLTLNIEKIKSNINQEDKKIESLNMKISELTSFDNVKDVVKDMGLAYNNENIVNIN